MNTALLLFSLCSLGLTPLVPAEAAVVTGQPVATDAADAAAASETVRLGDAAIGSSVSVGHFENGRGLNAIVPASIPGSAAGDVVSAMPEPGMWIMGLLGLAIVGLGLRRPSGLVIVVA